MYTLNKEYEYVIYGAAFMGDFVYKGLTESGYQVTAFLDKRANELKSVHGITVFHPDLYKCDKKTTVVIVAITNPFEHPMVADYLYKLGYGKIIYKLTEDMSVKSEFAVKMDSVYGKILDGKISEEVELTEYTNEYAGCYFENTAIIREEENDVIVYLPIELCFGGNSEWNESEIENNREMYLTEGKSILWGQNKILNLFRAFEGSIPMKEAVDSFVTYLKANPKRYHSFDRTEQGISDLITNRYNLFVQMSQLLNTGMDFFIRNPICAKWNENGYFQVIDGVHRVCFFVVKGLTRIPARISKVDYEKWVNMDALDECISYMREHDCPPAYTLIPHPYFYKYPTYRDTAGTLRITYICDYLMKQGVSLEGKSVLDIGSYFSYFAQYYARMGANVTTVEQYKESYEIGKHLNQLLYCTSIEPIFGEFNDVVLNKSFYMTNVLTVFYILLNTKQGEDFLKIVDRVTEKYLIWESGDKPQEEMNYIMENTTFKYYDKIAETYGTGKVRELGVFRK